VAVAVCVVVPVRVAMFVFAAAVFVVVIVMLAGHDRAVSLLAVGGSPQGDRGRTADDARPAHWLASTMTEYTTTDRAELDATALVIYASTHGHTAKIATRIAQAMQSHGLAVDLREVSSAPDADPACYDAVVVAASLHKERHQAAIADWVTAHRAALELRRTLLLSVSLTAAEDSDAARATTQSCIDEFAAQTGWTPDRAEGIAGCLQYREYDVFTRQLMRLLMKRGGHPTDAARDYDYTDWEALDRLGAEIAELVVPAGATPAR
jgi:menaquinone-dependent protoporphyrinogen oxidase